MSLKLRIGLLGIALSGMACSLAAQSPIEMSAMISPEVRAMAGRLGPPVAAVDTTAETAARSARTDDPRAALKQRIGAECPSAEDAGDITEALLVAGHDLFTAVYETILVCAAAETGPGVATAAARRAFFLRGAAPRYLIDAAVLEAAAEIAERQRQSATTSVAVVTPESAGPIRQRALEKERLRRMMEKGLIGDEYREYVDDRRALAEAMTPPAEPAADWYANVYNNLFTIGLVGGGGYDNWLDVTEDSGGDASIR
ncbi:MAG: hypothetical protein JZU52_12360 [Lamprocystis purpurea]|jgi:hypothetical protein|nr:hypothetical protein [Lamprocystis purpurea]